MGRVVNFGYFKALRLLRPLNRVGVLALELFPPSPAPHRLTADEVQRRRVFNPRVHSSASN